MDAEFARMRDNASDREFGRLKSYVWLLAVLLATLVVIRLAHPQVELTAATSLFLHNGMETFSIIVSALIFAFGWNVQRQVPVRRVSMLGFVFLAVACLDFFHMLSYLGMPAVVTPASPEKAIAFWLIARLVAALGLIAFATMPALQRFEEGAKWLLLASSLGLCAVATVAILFFPDWLPATFIPGEGLTPFKRMFEFLLIALYLIAAALMLVRGVPWTDLRAPGAPSALIAASIVAAMSEVFFTFYASVYDIYNAAGHVYKVIAYYLVYRALFVGALRGSYQIASDLRAELSDSNEHWQEAVAARGATEIELHRIIDTAMDAIVTIDEDQRIVLFNRAAEKIFGCEAASAIGSPLERFLPVRFRPTHREHVQRFGATGSTERAMGGGRALYGLRTSGEEFPIEASISHTAAGGKRLYTVILCDVTATRRLQDELRFAEQRWRQAIDAGGQGVFEWHAGTNRVYRSERYLQVLGLTNDEIEASPHGWLDFIHPDDRPRAARMSPLSGADIPNQFAEELRMLARDGAERWIAVHGLVTGRDAAGMPQHLIGTVSDITERQRSQRMLGELAARVLSDVEEERRRIARSVHDELGQTMTALRLDMEEMKVRIGDPARTRELIERMDHLVGTGVSEMRRLINALRPQLLDDLGVAAAAEHLLEQTCDRLGLRTDFHEAGDLSDLPDALQLMLYRITQEALTNIAKHAKAGNVQFRLTRTDDAVHLYIRDDGLGFDTSMPRKAGSFGLFGMQERATLVGGTVAVRSAPGEGASISVRFPVARGEGLEPVLTSC
ncbi:MAG: MASE3 domain-containing protein [Burkholderiales bacterium]